MNRRFVFAGIAVAAGIALLVWGIISLRNSKESSDARTEKKVILKKETLKQESKKAVSFTAVKDINELTSLIEKGSVSAFESGLNLANSLIESGDFIAAREVYMKLLRSMPGHSDIAELEKNIWALNMKILFSKIEEPYSLIYEVNPGDTLVAIARKFNTTIELIKRSNGLNSDLIRIEQRLKVINAPVSIIVDKSQNVLTFKINDEIVKVYPCSTGQFNSTPVGKFKIVNKLVEPTWFKAGAIVPPDSPDNILGSRWMGFDSGSGYGIHGTTEPETIGQQITAGCVRMYNSDVEELYDIVPVGSEVTIID